MQIRDTDLIQWQLAFERYQTYKIPLIVDRAVGSYQTTDEYISVTPQLVQHLPQLHHFATVYPHVLKCDQQYVFIGKPHTRPSHIKSGHQVKHWFVCATYHQSSDNVNDTHSNNGQVLSTKTTKSHMSLQIKHANVHKYLACIGVKQPSTCATCNERFVYEQLLIAHLKRNPDHRTEPATRRHKLANQDTDGTTEAQSSSTIAMDNAFDNSYTPHAAPPSQYKPALVDRTAKAAYTTPLIRVEELAIQYSINNILYDYVPNLCRKQLLTCGQITTLIAGDSTTVCHIILSGKREHIVLSDPLPYYVLVQQYYCSTHHDTFNCLRHNLPSGANISPDIMAVGSSDSNIGKPSLIDRSFYCNLITRYTNHFNATSLSNDIYAVWQQNWISINKRHEMLRISHMNYVDPGVDNYVDPGFG